MDNDTISRQAALNELTLMTEKHKGDTFSGELLHWTGIKTMIENLPSVQPEQKTGRWENDENCSPRCSCCSYIPEFNRYIDDYYYSDYCPNCGAKMENGGNLFD